MQTGFKTIYEHPGRATRAPLLVFLHGRGEAYRKTNNRESTKHIRDNGPPGFVGSRPAAHPLRRFTLVAPQLPDWQDRWVDFVQALMEVIEPHRRRAAGTYLMGYSNGGNGALLLAERVEPEAIVTIDATRLDATPAQARASVGRRPLWAIYTDAEKSIHRFNQALLATEHDSFTRAPDPGSQVRTLVPGLTHGKLGGRVSRSVHPYNWLLLH